MHRQYPTKCWWLWSILIPKHQNQWSYEQTKIYHQVSVTSKCSSNQSTGPFSPNISAIKQENNFRFEAFYTSLGFSRSTALQDLISSSAIKQHLLFPLSSNSVGGHTQQRKDLIVTSQLQAIGNSGSLWVLTMLFVLLKYCIHKYVP